MTGLRHDLDDIAVAQLVTQRNDAVVHLCARRRMAYIGMNRIRKIDGAGVLRQHHNLALGSERVDLFGVQIDPQRRHELVGIGHLTLPLHQLADPGQTLLVLGGNVVGSLVLPVRGDAFFRDLVHVLGAYLHFELMSTRSDKCFMQRLILIRPRHHDEVFAAPRNRLPRAAQWI